MNTTFGTNLKLTIATEYQARVRALFVDVLGASTLQPRPNLEVYRLADGGNVGVYYVDDPAEALSPSDQRKGAWLELCVADKAQVIAQIEALGIERVTYSDQANTYFQVPGGPVFRVASVAS